MIENSCAICFVAVPGILETYALENFLSQGKKIEYQVNYSPWLMGRILAKWTGQLTSSCSWIVQLREHDLLAIHERTNSQYPVFMWKAATNPTTLQVVPLCFDSRSWLKNPDRENWESCLSLIKNRRTSTNNFLENGPWAICWHKWISDWYLPVYRPQNIIRQHSITHTNNLCYNSPGKKGFG
jgi:hypothetical protein